MSKISSIRAKVVFDYGLPTASQIAGITTEVRDWWGFDLYGEFNVSTQYPPIPLDDARIASLVFGDSRR